MKSRVIYIIGSGRSGTTLLDILLGNADDIFSAGELNRYTEKNGIPPNMNRREANDFWNEILNQLSEKNFSSPIYYFPLSKKFEHHFGFFHLINNNKKDFEAYADYQKTFFDILFKKVGSAFNKYTIIDSSKYPLRGYFLSKVLGNSISYIYISRNPMAVVESFQKKDVEQAPKSRLMANLYLLGINSLARTILKKIQKTNTVTFISYENLLVNPISVLNKIEAELNVSLKRTKELITQKSSLQVGYLFDGNRLRFEKEIKFREGNSLYKPKKLIDKLFFLLHKKVWYK